MDFKVNKEPLLKVYSPYRLVNKDKGQNKESERKSANDSKDEFERMLQDEIEKLTVMDKSSLKSRR